MNNYKTNYHYKTHSDDPRIPDEEGWQIAIWPKGEALPCYPTSGYPYYENAFSSFETALTYLLEIYEDNLCDQCGKRIGYARNNGLCNECRAANWKAKRSA
jgi:hypothetical protein